MSGLACRNRACIRADGDCAESRQTATRLSAQLAHSITTAHAARGFKQQTHRGHFLLGHRENMVVSKK